MKNEVKPTSPRWPLSLWLGLVLITITETLLFIDVARRGSVVMPSPTPLPEPIGTLGLAARWAAVNITILCWVGYLLALDGLLTLLALRYGNPHIAPARARPNRFAIACLTSVSTWCFFDWINFYFMDAWRYHGLPPSALQRRAGMFIAFAAITPAMLMAAQAYQYLGLRRLKSRPPVLPRGFEAASVAVGALLFVTPFLVHDPIANLALWVSVFFLLDPISGWLGGPSLIADWRAGRAGRTIALMAGGATCGLLWEFWNYWAIAKWTYRLPFLGPLENYRYFEMPWLGFLGFLPFAIECWLAVNVIVAVLDRLGILVAEPLPDEDAVL